MGSLRWLIESCHHALSSCRAALHLAFFSSARRSSDSGSTLASRCCWLRYWIWALVPWTTELMGFCFLSDFMLFCSLATQGLLFIFTMTLILVQTQQALCQALSQLFSLGSNITCKGKNTGFLGSEKQNILLVYKYTILKQPYEISVVLKFHWRGRVLIRGKEILKNLLIGSVTEKKGWDMLI